jgi:hypothetical protein
MARKKISLPDYAWLRLNEPNNLMVITGLMTFDAPLDYESLKAALGPAILRFKRFRQRLVQPNLPFRRPYWEVDPTFTIDSHLTRVQLPSPADQKTLQDLISSLMSTELIHSSTSGNSTLSKTTEREVLSSLDCITAWGMGLP